MIYTFAHKDSCNRSDYLSSPVLRATGSGGVNEGLTLWTAGRSGLRLAHAAEVAHARRVAEIVPLIVHSSRGFLLAELGLYDSKFKVLFSKAPSMLQNIPPNFTRGLGLSVPSLDSREPWSSSWEMSLLSAMAHRRNGNPVWGIFELLFQRHTSSERETGAVIGAVQRGVVLKSSTHCISNDMRSLEIKVNRLFYKQSDQRESILSPVSESESLDNITRKRESVRGVEYTIFLYF